MGLCELEISLVHRASSWTARVTQKVLPEKNKTKRRCALDHAAPHYLVLSLISALLGILQLLLDLIHEVPQDFLCKPRLIK